MYTVAEKTLREIKKIIRENYHGADVDIVDRAYKFAKQAHEGQFRKSGKPHLEHAIATGRILAGWHMPVDLVIAGILHDIPEDTGFTLEDIGERFGQDVRDIIEGETKLSTLHYRGRERYAENLRKMFFAIAKDARVVIVKCADRIDNLKTLNFFSEDKQKRIALETMEIYAPIANRLGMGVIKGELEDLAFQYADPKDYEWVSELEKDRVHKKEEHLEKAKAVISQILKANGFKDYSIHGRVKHLYSLYKKLLRYDRDINKIYDLVALRIIVPSVSDCYAVLGLIHQRWTPLKGRIKDYIAQPKPNGYQSLHTTIFCDDGEVVEFQIRTEQMHEEAEFGVAAHWFYDDVGHKPKKVDPRVKWLKELADIQKNIQDRNKFLQAVESLKIDFFQNRIFVFTPKGDVIDLPEGATPVDYAYAIHTEVGNHCARAMVNGKIESLSASLQSGDVVQIITEDKRKGPSSDWLKFVKTAHARDKINESIKNTKLPEWMRELIHVRKNKK